MTFAIRARLETVFGPEGVGLTLEQIGYAFTPAFWGFTVAMMIGGPLVDTLGMKKITWLAFGMHAIGIIWTLMATSMTSLFLATLFVGIGNGMVEAACNPLVASMYPTEKTKMLNRFHVWFPGGIVIGSVVGFLVMDVMGLGWQVMVGSLFIPLVIYGYLFLNQEFPVTERVEMGVSTKDMWGSLATPLFLFMGFCMLLTAATELGTNQRIESLLSSSGTNALLVLAFINGIMAMGRGFAGPVAHRLSTSGMLWFSAIFSFIGLMMFTIVGGAMTFVAAAVFAVGITFFWPTMIAFVAENIPQSGALGLSVMGGLGMLSVSFVLPIMGKILDDASGVEAIKLMAILPAILIILFGGPVFLYETQEGRGSECLILVTRKHIYNMNSLLHRRSGSLSGFLYSLFTISILILLPGNSQAQLRTSRLFSDHAVLQRGKPIPVWGKASPRGKIVVILNGQIAKAKADKDGFWKGTLPAMEAGGPFDMAITSGKESISLSDIWIGDVWVCSGQSNMEWVLENTEDAANEITSANEQRIRHFKVPRTPMETLQDTLPGGKWQVASPETAARFTAVGYYFAQKLVAESGITIRPAQQFLGRQQD